MNVALYINASKFKEKDKEIENFINENSDISFFIPEEDFSKFNFSGVSLLESFDEIDLIFSIGGDGTVLSTIRRIKFIKKPVLGIKFGNLGFLTSVNFEEFASVKQEIINQDYLIESRCLVEVQRLDEQDNVIYHDYALNDIVLEREDIARMSTVDAFVDGEFFTTYHSNGVIVASPTGSTAYNLSAGGPIVFPDSRSMVLTPICPHSLTQRPVVVSHRTVELALRGRVKMASLTLDGQREQEIFPGDRIRVKISDKSINLVKLKSESFPTILRHKLGWGK